MLEFKTMTHQAHNRQSSSSKSTKKNIKTKRNIKNTKSFQCDFFGISKSMFPTAKIVMCCIVFPMQLWMLHHEKFPFISEVSDILFKWLSTLARVSFCAALAYLAVLKFLHSTIFAVVVIVILCSIGLLYVPHCYDELSHFLVKIWFQGRCKYAYYNYIYKR